MSVAPGTTFRHLLKAVVAVSQINGAEDRPVAILFFALNLDCLTLDFVDQASTASLAACLILFRGVDSEKAHPVLAVGIILNEDRSNEKARNRKLSQLNSDILFNAHNIGI